MENLQFCATSYMRIEVTSNTLACAVNTITWPKNVVSEAENAFLHIEYCGGDICTETVR